MDVTPKQARFLRAALQSWQQQGLLSAATANTLSESLSVQLFDWKRLARYSFWVALISFITSLSAILADKALIDLLESIFNSSNLVKFIVLSLFAAAAYAWGARRRLNHPAKSYSNETIIFAGVLLTASAIYQFGQMVDNGSGHFSILLLLGALLYGAIAVAINSSMVWTFSLLSLGSWMGAETGYASGWGAYYLGMNYPLRFVLFGLVLTGFALLTEKQPAFKIFRHTTLAIGLLYLFIALWILSIFGNYGDTATWREVQQIELFHWSLLFACCSLAAIGHGLKFENTVSRGFGLTFLFINLYTRFFEYFWDVTHKAIFFALLAVSFWFIGTHAEKIWNLGRSLPPKTQRNA